MNDFVINTLKFRRLYVYYVLQSLSPLQRVQESCVEGVSGEGKGNAKMGGEHAKKLPP